MVNINRYKTIIILQPNIFNVEEVICNDYLKFIFVVQH